MAFGAGFTSFPVRRCFPFLAVGHSPSYRQRKRSLGSARDDNSGRTFFQRTLYTIQRISIPHAVISSAARNLPCTLLFLAPFAKGFPFSAITHTTLSPPARKIPRLRSGWRCVNTVPSHFPSTFPVITIRAKRHQHSRRFYFLCAAPHPWTRQPEP